MSDFQASGIVTLLSDFGQQDSYVAQMKGVMLGLLPLARLVDVTHDVPPQDLLEGAFQLAAAWRAFPAGTVHLAVVDPGVGTERRAVALAFRQHAFVLPDNGLATLVLGDERPDRLVVLDREAAWCDSVARTFHGRDIFAPVAARLAAGQALETVGTPADPGGLIRLALVSTRIQGDRLRAPIVSIDRFGNCRTLVAPEDLPPGDGELTIRCGRLVIGGLSGTFGEVSQGQPVALFGSHGGLEIAVNGGSAARAYGLDRGDLVEIQRE